MRVIAGRYRRQLLAAPAGWKTRPTSDRLRETLFNVLAPAIEGAVFADLFAGTGAAGIEALSRGAAMAYFAENARATLTALRSNLTKLGIGPEAKVEPGGTAALLRRLAREGVRLDIVFLDPPYEDAHGYRETMELLGSLPVLTAEAIVVAEHSRRQEMPTESGTLRRYRVIEQSESALSFYR